MSDLHQETFQAGTAELDITEEQARDAGSRQQYETAESAERSYGEYAETDAEVEARIAGQDELPSREESRQATWGDDPSYYDETELGTEYDGDAGAFLAAEDELPTPQDPARAPGATTLSTTTRPTWLPSTTATLARSPPRKTARPPRTPWQVQTLGALTPSCPQETTAMSCHQEQTGSRRWRPSMTRPGRRSRTWRQS